jgi:shikimate kinase
MKHTGKSVLARAVSRKMQREAIDVDEEVERLHAEESSRRRSVRDIYRLDGGKTFQRLEATACGNAARTGEPVVVATGGGLCDNDKAIAQLDRGVIVALDADPELLFRRIIRKGIPAFMSAKTRPEAWVEFQNLYRRRSARYREMAHIIVRVDDRPPDEMAAELLVLIEEHLNGGK